MACRAEALTVAKRIKWDEAATAAQNARRNLPELVKEYFAQGRAVARGKPSPAAINRFTLRTRRLSYSLELFQSYYGPGLGQRLDLLRRVERLLEDLDDCATARRIFGKISQVRLRHFLDDRARRKLEEFRACWTAEVDAKGQEQAWREYLARARSR
jgi:CHAD domain-containing protein